LLTVGLTIGLAASAYFSAQTTGSGASALPSGCVRPPGGFLIIASSLGYNDSIEHGAPTKSWPILDVSEGMDVNITVCNTYLETVGLQVAHYFADKTEAIKPGDVVHIGFLANQTGTFEIYCDVFNPLHIYLQGGELNVS
jgi:hypothetical protein